MGVAPLAADFSFGVDAITALIKSKREQFRIFEPEMQAKRARGEGAERLSAPGHRVVEAVTVTV